MFLGRHRSTPVTAYETIDVAVTAGWAAELVITETVDRSRAEERTPEDGREHLLSAPPPAVWSSSRAGAAPRRRRDDAQLARLGGLTAQGGGRDTSETARAKNAQRVRRRAAAERPAAPPPVRRRRPGPGPGPARGAQSRAGARPAERDETANRIQATVPSSPAETATKLPEKHRGRNRELLRAATTALAQQEASAKPSTRSGQACRWPRGRRVRGDEARQAADGRLPGAHHDPEGRTGAARGLPRPPPRPSS